MKDLNPILVFGSANAERVLLPEGPVVVGGKNTVATEDLFGGSGVNYSVRLLAQGYPAIPILNAGADQHGKELQAFMVRIARLAGCDRSILDYLSSSRFFASETTTASSIILVDNGLRTIFRGRSAASDPFARSLSSRIDELEQKFGANVSAVLIGHLSAPQVAASSRRQDPTHMVIERFVGRAPIFANFGHSQLARGYNYWRALLPKLDLLQLNREEACAFFGPPSGSTQLGDIIDFIKAQGIRCVITLDKFGAVCIPKEQDGGNRFIFVPAYIDDENLVRDPTGAGDAFFAGTVSHLVKAMRSQKYPYPSSLGTKLLVDASDIGRKWAAFACTQIGGASAPPDAATLQEFLAQADCSKVQPVAPNVFGTVFKELERTRKAGPQRWLRLFGQRPDSLPRSRSWR